MALHPADSVYKILRTSEHEVFERFGRFAGSPDDERDGFVHLSFAHQVPATAAKYFEGEDIVLVELSAASMGEAIRYEASRGGALFPHLYGAMMRAMVSSHSAVAWEEGGHAIALSAGTLRVESEGPFGALAAELPAGDEALGEAIHEAGLEALLVGTGDATLEGPGANVDVLVALRARLRASEAH